MEYITLCLISYTNQNFLFPYYQPVFFVDLTFFLIILFILLTSLQLFLSHPLFLFLTWMNKYMAGGEGREGRGGLLYILHSNLNNIYASFLSNSQSINLNQSIRLSMFLSTFQNLFIYLHFKIYLSIYISASQYLFVIYVIRMFRF